jgi:hypothetical protein
MKNMKMEIYKNRYLRNIVRITMGEKYLKRFYKKHKSSLSTIYTISFDVDFKNDVFALPWLIDKLNEYKLPSVFAVVGRYVEKYPHEHFTIIDYRNTIKHEIINHTYSHPWNDETNPDKRWDKLSIFEKEKEIIDCQEICKIFLGKEPVGFRIPHFGAQYTEDVYDILYKLKFKYDSSRIATHINNPNPHVIKNIWEFPMSSCPLHPFDLFDTWHSLNRGPKHHHMPGQFYNMFEMLVKMAEENGAYVNFYIDPQDVYKNDDFIKMLKYLSERRDRVKTYSEIING